MRSTLLGTKLQVLCAQFQRGCPRGVMVKALDCVIVVSEFVLQSHYYVHFRANTLGERYEPPYPPSYGLNSTTTVLLVCKTYQYWWIIGTDGEKESGEIRAVSIYIYVYIYIWSEEDLNLISEKEAWKIIFHPTITILKAKSVFFFFWGGGHLYYTVYS